MKIDNSDQIRQGVHEYFQRQKIVDEAFEEEMEEILRREREENIKRFNSDWLKKSTGSGR